MASYPARLFVTLCAFAGFALAPICAHAAQFQQGSYQAEQRDGSGRLTVEAANIYPFTCNGAGENGQSYYLYQYLKRSGFRAIRPPDWGHAIGGRDYATWQQAVAVACAKSTGSAGGSAGGGVTPSGFGITGTWKLTSDCFPPNVWTSTLTLYQAADGSLTGSASNDTINPEVSPTKDSWGSTMKSRYIGNTMTLLLHPKGWVSVLELTGTRNGNTIAGKVHHYTNDDCTFSMAPA